MLIEIANQHFHTHAAFMPKRQERRKKNGEKTIADAPRRNSDRPGSQQPQRRGFRNGSRTRVTEPPQSDRRRVINPRAGP